MDPIYLLQPPDPKEIDDFIENIAREIVDRHLAAPAIVTLESMKPLSFAGSQLMVFFDPIIQIFGGIRGYEKFQVVLEDRNKLERLIVAIEKYEDEKIRKKKVNKDA